MKLTDPDSGVAEYIIGLAQQHGVHYNKTPSNELADVITRLAYNEIVSDEIEDLLVALKRAHVIDADTLVALLGNYLKEKKQ